MKNNELVSAIESLHNLGETKLPLPVAFRMVKMRKYFAALLEDIEEARKQFIENNFTYIDEHGASQTNSSMDSSHPQFGLVVASIDSLLNEEVDLSELEPLVLYEKNDAYSWTKEFTTTEVADISPNVLFGIMPILEIQTL